MATRSLLGWRGLPLRWQMTILVAGLTVATLAAFGLFLDLRLTTYLEASSAAHLHQLADPIIGGETRHVPFRRAEPGQNSTIQDVLLLGRLAADLAIQVDGPDSFAVVATPDGRIVPLPASLTGRSVLPTTTLPIDPAILSRAISGPEEVRLVVNAARGRYLVLLVPLAVDEQVVGVAVLGDSLAPGEALLSTFRLSLLLGTLVAAIAAGLAARALISRALRPLGEV